MSRWNFDVAILGAGPAGCLLAIELAKQGFEIALFSNGEEREYIVGETIPSVAQPLLRELGIFELLTKNIALPSYGTCSYWGSVSPYYRDAFTSPYGPGWHINRKAFQLTLQERTLGFSNIRLYTVGECEFTQSARYLVDATGRRSVLANQLGSSRHYFDKQIALVAVFHTPKACDSERHILIESTPSGWWYSSHLPENRRVVMFFTDGDLISTEKRSLSQTLQQRLRETDHTSRILYQYDYQPCFDPWVERAGNSIQNRIAGGNWLSVGDAAATFNPITAQGLITAFRFVLKAREALALAIRAGSPISLHYHNAYREHFTKICKLQFELFQQETRWPKSTYWKRRQCKLQDSFTLNESAVAS